MDNNDFFNNDGNNDRPVNDASDEDIFAEETVEDAAETPDDHAAGNAPVNDSGQYQNDNTGASDNASDQDRGSQHTENGGAQTWNQSRVNPDQWQAYRHGQHGPYQQHGPQGPNQWNRQYGPQNPYNNWYSQQGPYQNYGYNGYYEPDNSGGFGIASMVLGIISLLCFCSFLNILPAVLAIVFGCISLSRRKSNPFAVAGIVCAAVSLALLIITVVLFSGNMNLMNAFEDYMNNYGNGFGNYFR
ncbi:MAG: DUF4190 domain-containing protein [Lachnospiraceae bacterium]|nr:DUF4190 domain-containing protein [Lachnospiraceae bacterium]MDD7326624.1 DUF4190 domain-containing protein [Lachnospiraceae bacterium]MDY2758755.1 DUF4190 domain-containing protein [Lachnospiraceae bacterium]